MICAKDVSGALTTFCYTFETDGTVDATELSGADGKLMVHSRMQCSCVSWNVVELLSCSGAEWSVMSSRRLCSVMSVQFVGV